MKAKKYNLTSFLIIAVLGFLIFGIARMRSLTNAYSLQTSGIFHPSDEAFVVQKGNVYTSDGVLILEKDQPVEDCELNPLLGNLLGYHDATVSDTVFSSILPYTYGSVRTKKGSKFDGYHVRLTISGSLQKHLAKLLAGTDGQAVAINYKTGAIVASIAKGKSISIPDCYNRETFSKQADEAISYDTKTGNSVCQELIYPGSTIKPILACAILETEKNDALLNYSIRCTSRRILMNPKTDYRLRCYHGAAHGTVTLKTALPKSCNKFLESYIVTRGLAPDVLNQKMSEFGLVGRNKELLPVNQTDNLFLSSEDPQKSLDYAAIGQGDTHFSLLSICSVYGAIANNGVLAEPHYVKSYFEITDNAEELDEKLLAIKTHPIMTPETAVTVTDILRNTVLAGTGGKIGKQIDKDFHLSVKTGTSDQKDGSTHKLCISYSNTEDYPYVFAIEIPEKQGDATALTKSAWTYFYD